MCTSEPSSRCNVKLGADLASVPINRVKCINPNLVVSGDDDGVIKVNLDS